MKLRVSDNQRYLTFENGSAFIPVADTAWELPQKLKREAAEFYFSFRKEQGFNSILMCALPEDNCIFKPNRYGNLPFEKTDPDRINEPYWNDLENFLEIAEQTGLTVFLLPTWGDKFNKLDGFGPEIFTPENAFRYGVFIAERFSRFENLVWVLGGDRPLIEKLHFDIIDNMAAGIRKGEKTRHLMTFHPGGAKSSYDYLKGRDSIDFHSLQSSHGTEGADSHLMLDSVRKGEQKPCVDMECRYEDFPINFNQKNGTWDDYDVRTRIYSNLVAGGCGIFYGHADIWCFHDNWVSSLRRPGAFQIMYAKALMKLRPFYELRLDNGLLFDHNSACIAGIGKSFALVYCPEVQPVRLAGKRNCTCFWFDPKTGTTTPAKEINGIYTPAASGRGNDIVLIIDFI